MGARLPEKDSAAEQAREGRRPLLSEAGRGSPPCGSGDGQATAEGSSTLRSANDLLGGIIEGSHDLIGAIDADFRYIVFNRKYAEEFQRIFGIPIHLGDSMVKLLAPWPEQQAKAMALARRALGGETLTAIENFGAPGRERHVYEIRCGPILDRQRRPIGTSHVVRDVTDRQLTEEALRQSERRYRQLLAAVTTYTYTVTLHQGVPLSTEHSPGCVAATGYSPADYQNNSGLWIQMVPAEDRPLVLAHVDAVLAGRSMPPLQHRIVHKDGSTRWVRDTIVPHYDEKGQLLRYDGLVEDVTERKRVEERFRQLLESTPDAMLVVDHSGRIVLVNEPTEQMFGYRREELLGQPLEMLVPGQLRELHARHRSRYMAQPRARAMNSGVELSALRKDGREFPAEINLRPVVTEEGVLVFSAIRDITERKSAERSLRENAAQLLAVQRIQEHLLPRCPPRIAGLDIAGASYPAEFAGGDYFDYLAMPDNALGIVVGDVAGHGFGPALLMASIHAHLQWLSQAHADVSKILALLNSALLREIEEERFVTLLLGKLDLGTRSLVYSNAGHPAGYVLNQAGHVKARLESGSMPLGISGDNAFLTGGPVVLEPGELLLLLTDGILEAQAADNAQFGIRRTLEIVRSHRQRTATEIIEILHDEVIEFSARHKIADDLTAVIVKVLP